MPPGHWERSLGNSRARIGSAGVLRVGGGGVGEGGTPVSYGGPGKAPHSCVGGTGCSSLLTSVYGINCSLLLMNYSNSPKRIYVVTLSSLVTKKRGPVQQDSWRGNGAGHVWARAPLCFLGGREGREEYWGEEDRGGWGGEGWSKREREGRARAAVRDQRDGPWVGGQYSPPESLHA